MRSPTSAGSLYTVSDSESEAYDPEPESSRKRFKTTSRRAVEPKLARSKAVPARVKGKTSLPKPRAVAEDDIAAIEEAVAGPSVQRPHALAYHDVGQVADLQEDLLAWFERVRDTRGMPWRKQYDPTLTMEAKGQRAYEIWVSEIMLQQTQVATVIAYWERWIDKWPTIADLAQADVEEVNAMWRGLGYYRRARSLLAGAKTVMGNKKYGGRLPDDPVQLEKEIEGVGRYTAGAICSMAYGVKTPIVDGNVHRLLTRLLAIHANQVSPRTIKALWTAAQELVQRLPDDEDRKGIAGDWNQALMELGSQVCKPGGPDCAACPLRTGCKAFSELNGPPQSVPVPGSTECDLCEPIPVNSDTNRLPSVTIFPMRKQKKLSREEQEVVCVTEWRSASSRKWLLVKRPDKGLLAGLFEPPAMAVSSESSTSERKEATKLGLAALLDISTDKLETLIKSHNVISSISHIFSHINMTYHIQYLVLEPTTPSAAPPAPKGAVRQALWLDSEGVEHANVGTGVKKIWSEIYGSWGSCEAVLDGAASMKTDSRPTGSTKRKPAPLIQEGKVVKKIMMPMMPTKRAG